MIISVSTFDAFKYAAIGGFVIAVGAAFVLLPKDLDRASERARRIRRNIVVVLALLLLFVVAGFAIEPFGAPFVAVRIEPTNVVTKTRARVFGSSSYALQDGHFVSIANEGKTIVINDTKLPMRVKVQSYGDSAAAFLTSVTHPDETIDPMASASFDHAIDFVGPDDPPPPQVQGVYAEDRYWLVWPATSTTDSDKISP